MLVFYWIMSGQQVQPPATHIVYVYIHILTE